ncbi:MAG: hypothetical protein J6Y58_02050 [Clostridiales bacterium]|nr:hypothetical protein [Clostridiales bacterium]
MSDYNYVRISRIKLSASSSGMMMGSNKSDATEVVWEKDGRTFLVRTVIEGYLREVSTWNLTPELAEKIRRTAERIDMASWGNLKYEEDPRFRCTDYSSSAGGSIILDYRDLSGKPYEIMNFDQRAVTAAGKGEDLKALEDLLSGIADPDTRASVEKTETTNAMAPAMNGFMGMGMMKMPTEGGWTCKCGTLNTGKFCSECGLPRP